MKMNRNRSSSLFDYQNILEISVADIRYACINITYKFNEFIKTKRKKCNRMKHLHGIQVSDLSNKLLDVKG